MNQTIIVPVAQVVELGSAASLTLGNGSGAYEGNRPVRIIWTVKKNSSTAQVIELGKVTALTLGGYGQSTEHVRQNQHRQK